MDSNFIIVCNFGIFKNPLATITTLPELYFTFTRFTVRFTQKSDFYELRQQHKQLKTMEMSEA